MVLKKDLVIIWGNKWLLNMCRRGQIWVRRWDIWFPTWFYSYLSKNRTLHVCSQDWPHATSPKWCLVKMVLCFYGLTTCQGEIFVSQPNFIHICLKIKRWKFVFKIDLTRRRGRGHSMTWSVWHYDTFMYLGGGGGDIGLKYAESNPVDTHIVYKEDFLSIFWD